MKQLLMQRGEVVLADVPEPTIEPGRVLVRVSYSCISIGSELAGIHKSGMPLWRRALKQPESLMVLFEHARRDGWAAVSQAVRRVVSLPRPLGYSCAGIVQAVGDGVSDLAPGARVACGGSQFAFHAEMVSVPRNLVARVPDGVDLREASTATLGAIALQGIRRAEPTLGETFVVVGLGLIGQLTVQMLRANGCSTIGVDPDLRRVALAQRLGLDAGAGSGKEQLEELVARMTHALGADGVIITASNPSNEILSTAFQVCRKKGRVVLVGDVGMRLRREDMYEKELDLRISTSYGPGRYDPRYEEEGVDYPVAYVRWTENRNLEAYLEQLARGTARVSPLIDVEIPLAEAPALYATLHKDTRQALGALVVYPGTAETQRAVSSPVVRGRTKGEIGIAVIGAGGYACSVHLPNICEANRLFQLRAVVSRTGHSAAATARRFGAEYATTDSDRVFGDATVDAVIIATRHDSHAELAYRALQAGKHVLVEKPLATDAFGLGLLRSFFEESGRESPVLLTGYNRRFSPFVSRILAVAVSRSEPLVITYRMNAGRLPPDHWVLGSEGGGRNIGEACHLYDLFTAIIRAPVMNSWAAPVIGTGAYRRSENFLATCRFADGSIASLCYTAQGDLKAGKERMELFLDGTVGVLDDYRRLTWTGKHGVDLKARKVEKGQRELLVAFAAAIRGETPWPIPLWEQWQGMEIALAVESWLAGGRTGE